MLCYINWSVDINIGVIMLLYFFILFAFCIVALVILSVSKGRCNLLIKALGKE